MGVPAGDVEKGKKVKIKTIAFYVWFATAQFRTCLKFSSIEIYTGKCMHYLNLS